MSGQLEIREKGERRDGVENKVNDEEIRSCESKNGKPETDGADTGKMRKNVSKLEGLNSIVVDHPADPYSSRKRSIDDINYELSSTPPQKRKIDSEKPDVADGSVIYQVSYEDEGNVSSEPNVIINPSQKDSPIYNMNLKKRGKCVIFNQQEFDRGNGPFRKGSEKDVIAIKRTFGNLDFEVKEHLNLTFTDVMNEINELGRTDHTDCDCICIFVLTHGTYGDRLYARNASYPFLNIWQPFTADCCTTLAGKPKLFFIQACRGEATDPGVQARSVTDADQASYTIPSYADFLFGFSTVDEFYSFRHESLGSWYIQSLCKVIDEHWKTTDLLKMMTITSRKVALEYHSEHEDDSLDNMKQMPTVTSTLTRDIYFTPKKQP